MPKMKKLKASKPSKPARRTGERGVSDGKLMSALTGTSIVLNALCAKGRQVRNGPTAAKSFDEEHTRVHTPPQNVDAIPFIREFDRFSRDHLQVGIDSTLITIREKMQGIP
jgi:hypothetical protein